MKCENCHDINSSTIIEAAALQRKTRDMTWLELLPPAIIAAFWKLTFQTGIWQLHMFTAVASPFHQHSHVRWDLELDKDKKFTSIHFVNFNRYFSLINLINSPLSRRRPARVRLLSCYLTQISDWKLFSLAACVREGKKYIIIIKNELHSYFSMTDNFLKTNIKKKKKKNWQMRFSVTN